MEKNIANKTEYIFADYFRVVCAIGIVALHLDPFYDVNEYLNFFVGNVLTRLCVPFFFLLSGFFLKDKLSDWGRLLKYVTHLIKLYLVYSILYLPVNYYEYKDNGKPLAEDAINYVKKFFFVGSYGQLWYFLALIFAVIFLYVLISRCGLSDKVMLFIVSILFLVGLYFRVYDRPLLDFWKENKVYALYETIFKNTRNGLFFGVPFVYVGNLIWKKNCSVDRKRCSVLLIIAFFAMLGEAVFARYVVGAKELDMLLVLPVTSILFVLLVLSKSVEVSKTERGAWCRKMSVLIFGLHLFVYFVVEKIFENIGVNVNSLAMFLLVLLLTVVISVLLIWSKLAEKVFV